MLWNGDRVCVSAFGSFRDSNWVSGGVPFPSGFLQSSHSIRLMEIDTSKVFNAKGLPVKVFNRLELH